jgi:hypothetical protein
VTTKSLSTGSLYGPEYLSYYATGGDGKTGPDGTERWNSYYTTGNRQESQASKTGTYISGCSGHAELVSFTDSLALEAQSDIVDNAKGMVPNAIVNLAQGRQVYSMTLGLLQTVGGVALSLRKGRFDKAARLLGVSKTTSKLHPRDVAGRFLELRYGWQPLIQDCYDGWLAFSLNQSSKPRVIKIRGRKAEIHWHNSSMSPTLYSVLGPARCKYEIEVEYTERYPVERSLGLRDPASVVWEILPWSFVVDWFYPIGSYLEVLNALPALKVTRKRISRSYRYTGNGVYNGPYESLEGARTTCSSWWLDRQVSTSGFTAFDVAPPRFKGPSDAMSAGRIYNAIALAAQCFTKK